MRSANFGVLSLESHQPSLLSLLSPVGTMRGRKPGQRAAVKKQRAEKGIEAAIRAARRLPH